MRKNTTEVPTSSVLSSFCGSIHIEKGGPPACASVLVKPDRAPQNHPARRPGGAARAASRADNRSEIRNQRLSAKVTAITPSRSRIALTGSAPKARPPAAMPMAAPGSSTARCAFDQRPR